jgi:hypothetical protein
LIKINRLYKGIINYQVVIIKT